MLNVKEEVKNYYNTHHEMEWERLNTPYSIIEFYTTLHLIEKYLPKAGKICDIGAGPGRYAIELLRRGYEVTLFELSEEELKFAQRQIEAQNLQGATYICDDARHLAKLTSESYDAILLMGPMYHVPDDMERMQILKDVYRILKKGGTAIIAYINNWGVLKAGVTEFSESYREMEGMYNLLEPKKFVPGESFTHVYFTTPPVALEEVENAGFEIITYAGAESFLSGMHIRMKALFEKDPVVYNNLLHMAKETCELPQYRDATEHLHIVVRKAKQ